MCVRTAVSHISRDVFMTAMLPADLDYLTARLHGRRGRLAEGDRLDALCRLRNLPDLVRAVCPLSHFSSVNEFQRELIFRAVKELTEFSLQLTGAGSALTAWLRVRYQIENLKVLARAFATGRSLELVREYLVPLPEDLSLDVDALAAAGSVAAFAAAAPAGILRQGLADAAAAYTQEPRPIVLEAALDCAYFRELLTRTKTLPKEARDDSLPIAKQEVDTFHLMLVARGRFTYGLPPEQLAALHVDGAGISRNRYEQMLDAGSLQDAAQYTVGSVITKLPATESGSLDPAVLEAMAWNRYFQLACRAFRRSHMGLGAVIAFAAIRRVELANLITLSEGIRTEIDPDVIRSRLIPMDTEAIRV